CLGRLEIDDKIKFRWLDHWQFAGLLALEDTRSIDADLAVCVHQAGSITHQTSGVGKVAERIDGRDCMACRKRDYQVAAIIKERISTNKERANVSLREGRERRVDFEFTAGIHDLDPLLECACRSGSRSYLPSAQRYSIATVLPSSKPVSFKT